MLLRDLADAGAAVLLYTSELKEIQLVCDRVIVIFGGQLVDEMTAAETDEATLLRAAYNLRKGAQTARGIRRPRPLAPPCGPRHARAATP